MGPFKENVNHPAHYNAGDIEVIDFIEDWGLNFSLGNAVKYICRAPHKENKQDDLIKAAWYCLREAGLPTDCLEGLKSKHGLRERRGIIADGINEASK